MDAICKQRGSRNDGTGVGDSVVNQLLAKVKNDNATSLMITPAGIGIYSHTHLLYRWMALSN
jgi:hypothetical protein